MARVCTVASHLQVEEIDRRIPYHLSVTHNWIKGRQREIVLQTPDQSA
jgi:hypothetical protein